MGTDIQLVVEEKKDGVWTCIPPAKPYAFNLGSGYEIYNIKWWLTRSYALFSRLAGVRETEGFEQIDEIRGFPIDVSKEAVELFEDCGGYCKTWYTLTELRTYDWSQFKQFNRLLKDLSQRKNEVRLIIWFDC